MMKRPVVAVAAAVVVVLAAGYAGATAWTGKKAEERHAEYMTRLQAQAPFLKVVGQSYDRGFLSATSTSTFELGCASADGKPPPLLTLTETVRHGPLAGGTVAGAVIDSRFGFAGPAGERIAAMFSGDPLAVHTVVGFSGQATSTLTGGPAKVKLPDGAELAWQGLSGTVESSSDAKGFSYHVKSPGMTVADSTRGVNLRLAGLDMQAAGNFLGNAGSIGVGKGSGSVDAVEMAMVVPPVGGTEPKPVSVAFTGLQFTSETSAAGDLLTLTSTLGGAAVVNGAKIDRFDMQASMKRLHAPTYQKVMKRFANPMPACDSAGGKPATPAALLAEMQGDLMALAGHNPEVSLDRMTIDYGGKRGEIAYALGLQGVTAADTQLPPMALLASRGHATASMRIPVAWVQQLAQAGGARLQGAAPEPAVVDVMLDKAVGDGYLVRDGEFVKGSVDLTAGALTVNGKPMAPGGPRR